MARRHLPNYCRISFLFVINQYFSKPLYLSAAVLVFCIVSVSECPAAGAPRDTFLHFFISNAFAFENCQYGYNTGSTNIIMLFISN